MREKEKSLGYLRWTRTDVWKSIVKFIGVYRVITGERDDRKSSQMRLRHVESRRDLINPIIL